MGKFTRPASAARIVVLSCVIALVASAGRAQAQVDAATLQQWGFDALNYTETQLGRPGADPLYYESRNLNTNAPSGVNGYSFVWPLSTQFDVYNQLVRIDPATYTTPLRDLADAMDSAYLRSRTDINGNPNVLGYTAAANETLPGGRFYDDNAHLVFAYMDSYELTGESHYIDRAKVAHDFVMSGEWNDNGQTGGIRFVEDPNDHSSNTISVLQGARGAAMIYQATGERRFLRDASRLVNWANNFVQTPEGRYYQAYDRDVGGVCNFDVCGFDLVNGSAIAISANLELYEATGSTPYLDKAVDVANAVLGRFVNSQGILNDEVYWAFELITAFNNLTLQTGDPRWLNRSRISMEWMHANKRDANGNYGLFFSRNELPGTTFPYSVAELNFLAPVTHSYLHTANTLAEFSQFPSLEVDRDTGEVLIVNDTDVPIQLTSYTVLSPDGALDIAAWDSVAPDDGWSLGGLNTSTKLNEAGAMPVDLAVGESLSLGMLWLQTPSEDLRLEFNTTAASGGVSAVYSGDLIVRSDLDGNGTINAGDWSIFIANNEKPVGNTIAGAYLLGDLNGDLNNDYQDFLIFKSDFIAANGEAAFAALSIVPEPWTSAMALLAGLMLASIRSRSTNATKARCQPFVDC